MREAPHAASRNRVADLFATLCLIQHDHELRGLERDLRKLQADFDREPVARRDAR